MKKSAAYIFFICILCALFVSMSLNKTQYEFGKEDFVLHNRKNKVSLELNETVEAIKKKLGEPYEVRRVKPNENIYDLMYDNIIIQYIESKQKAYWIRAINPDFQTRRGVKVGDAVSKVYELYTEDEISEVGKFGNSDDQYIYLFFNLEWEGWREPRFELYFIHDGTTVTKVELQYYSW